ERDGFPNGRPEGSSHGKVSGSSVPRAVTQRGRGNMKRWLLAGLFAALLSIPAAGAWAQACPPEGDAVRQAVRDANVLKNRETAPTDSEIDQNVTLAAMVEPGEDQDRFNNDAGASIVGFVINVKHGGVETVNCHASAEIDEDTHIELALSRGAPEIERVIVE